LDVGPDSGDDGPLFGAFGNGFFVDVDGGEKADEGDGHNPRGNDGKIDG